PRCARRLLQGRLFAYADTQMYRVGANGLGLPVNRPRSEVNTVNQDGALNAGHSTSGVNYQPSRLDPREEQASARYVRTPLSGTTQQAKIQREQNFKQTGELFRSYGKKDQADLIASLGGALAITDDESKYIMLSYFYKADSDYGTGLAKVAGADLQRVRQLAAKLQD
ncbi:catalase KatB, partial [Pseudomonas aeruginosa]